MTKYEGKVFAVLPAAGRGRRMGRVKQLMPLVAGGRAMLAVVLQSLADSELAGVVLVTREVVWQELTQSEFVGLHLVWNEDLEAEMIDSVRLGLRKLEDVMGKLFERKPDEAENPDDGMLILPGDCPGVKTQIIDLCIKAFVENPGRIVVASFDGKSGHPMIFPQSLIPFVFSAACDNGLNALAQDYAHLVLRVECGSKSVLQNINTPEDLKGL